jgi:hypothetical protein
MTARGERAAKSLPDLIGGRNHLGDLRSINPGCPSLTVRDLDSDRPARGFQSTECPRIDGAVLRLDYKELLVSPVGLLSTLQQTVVPSM